MVILNKLRGKLKTKWNTKSATENKINDSENGEVERETKEVKGTNNRNIKMEIK
jgi:hypothetical protein